jgi:hypothetical protein
MKKSSPLDFDTIDREPNIHCEPNFSGEYYKTLFQCTIISEIVYEEDPNKALESDQYKYLNHGIRSFCVSKTIDDKENKDSTLDVKYMICDCSDDRQKRLIIGFRGTSSFQDFLVDINLIGKINECEGRFHSGIYKRSKKIPIKHFIEKLKNEKYEIIFTGHSLGAAIASLVTVQVLTHKAVLEGLEKKVQFIGFGSPLVACGNFKKFIEERYLNNFHFYANENDVVPKLLSILSNKIHSSPEIQDKVDRDPDLKKIFQNFIGLLINPSGFVAKEILTKVLPIALEYLAKQFVPVYVHFGRYYLLRITLERDKYSETFKIENSDFSEYENKKELKNILDTNQLLEFYQSHSIKNYYEKLKPFFKETNVQRSLKVFPLDTLIISNNFTKSSIDANRYGPNQNNFYNIQVFVNASFIDLCVTIWGNNIEYITASKLYNDYDSELKSVEAESNMGNFKRFNFFIDRFVNQDKLKKNNIFKLKLISHFNNILFNITISPDDVDTNGLTYREENISNISPDLLYIYGAFYVFVLKKLGDKLEGELERQCKELTNLFGELDEIWNIQGNKNMEKDQKDFIKETIDRYLDLECNIRCNKECLENSSQMDNNKKPAEFSEKFFTNKNEIEKFKNL